jgi:hypothetical protein
LVLALQRIRCQIIPGEARRKHGEVEAAHFAIATNNRRSLDLSPQAPSLRVTTAEGWKH